MRIMKKINFVSYFCYTVAALSMFGVFAVRSGIVGLIFCILLAGFWYQIGTSFLKRENWAWWVALVLISLFCIGSFISVYSAFVGPIFNQNMTGVGYGRWISLLLAVLSSYLVALLLQGATRNEFRKKTQQN